MPHQVVQHTLSHSLRPQVTHVELLISPLDPTSLRRYAIYQAQRINFFRMRQCKSGQDVGTGAHTETNYRFEAKVSENEEQLFRKLVHRWINVTEINIVD